MQLSFDFTKAVEEFEKSSVTPMQMSFLESLGLKAKNKREAMFKIDQKIIYASQKQRSYLIDLGYSPDPFLKKSEASKIIRELMEQKKQQHRSFFETSLVPMDLAV